jgi:hypothetical protein
VGLDTGTWFLGRRLLLASPSLSSPVPQSVYLFVSSSRACVSFPSQSSFSLTEKEFRFQISVK